MKKLAKYFIVIALILFSTLTVFISCDDAVKNAKAEFWEEFEAAVKREVRDKDIADVTILKENITVIFKDGIGETVEEKVAAVYAAAEALFDALEEMVDSGKLTLPPKKVFDIGDDDVVIEVAMHLLGGGSDKAQEFLTEGGEVSSTYSAQVKYKGEEFTLKGTLKFDMAD